MKIYKCNNKQIKRNEQIKLKNNETYQKYFTSKPVGCVLFRQFYVNQFIATQEGDYRVELQLPGSDDLLTREIRVRVPQLEIENSLRNDALLSLVAKQTSGQYFVGIPATNKSGNNGDKTLEQAISTRDQETDLPGTPDRDFEERLMGWLIAMISGVLCFEWIIRRLSKLA